MKRITIQVALSAIVLLGGATAAWAQAGDTATGFQCTVPAALFAGEFPAPVANQLLVAVDTEKTCPPTPTSRTVFMTCRGEVLGWQPEFDTFAFSTNNDFPCEISGAQCGFSGFSTANSRRFELFAGGEWELNCQANAAPQ
jgi:hypothetical protein